MTLTPSINILESRQTELTSNPYIIGMVINLKDKGFDVYDNGKHLTVEYKDIILPCQRYTFRPQLLKDIPPISKAYADLKDKHYTDEQIIKELINIYLPLKLFRVREFAKMPLVIGLIGQRGSGKTCGAVAIVVLDWLIRGLPVWSNVPIKVRVVYKDAEKTFESMPLLHLDLLDLAGKYRGGVALVDEVNMSAAEATRSSSGANLDFGYTVQQIRKNQMSVVWTCQGFSWVDNRLRWQTDFLIACRDAYLDNKCEASGIGDKSIWRIHDLSGMTNKFDYDYQTRHKFVTDYKVGDSMWWWNRPWWNAYNTYERQGQANYLVNYREQKRMANVEKIEEEAEKVVHDFLDKHYEEINVKDFWEQFNVKGMTLKKTVVSKMSEVGFIKKPYRDNGQYEYKFIRQDD